MKTEIPDIGKVQYYYTDLLFLLPEGRKLNIFFKYSFFICFPTYQPNIWNYFLNCYI